MIMTVREVLAETYIDRREAEIILCSVLKKDRLFVLVHSDYTLTHREKDLFLSFAERRKKGEPLCYILKKREFYGREFTVSENTLIPRPETELIIDEAKKLFRKTESIKVLDLCTGSGCIGITISCEFPLSRVIMSDICPKALCVCNENLLKFTEKYSLSGHWTEIVRSDMFENIPKIKYDLIVSNPPYIPTEDIKDLDPDVKREPAKALDGGKDGLDFYRIIFCRAGTYLSEKGYIILECGFDQSESIRHLAEKNGYECTFAKDFQNIERCAVIKKKI